MSQFNRTGEPRVFHRAARRNHAGPGSAKSGSVNFLRRSLPDSWRFAQQMSVDLRGQVEFLNWMDRADVFDTYFVRQAEVMVGPEGVLVLVDGGAPIVEAPPGVPAASRRFAFWARTLITSVLMDLNEAISVHEPDQALTYLLSRDLLHAQAGARWAGQNGMQTIGETLERLPGYALVMLASTPSDTAARFVARDGFWTAVRRAQS